MHRDPEVWDLIVVGGGTAGIVAAKTAANLGAKVLLIERHKTGGDCLWTGCVPSKSLLAVAHKVAVANSNAEMGITSTGLSIDFPTVMKYVSTVIDDIAPQDSPESLESAGVRVIQGEAKFQSKNSVLVDGRAYQFRKAVLAMGASPAVPPIPGLTSTNYLTSENVWHLTALPKKLIIVGAGSIGCELGQAFSRLGSEVTLIDGAERILPREDPLAAQYLSNHFAREGIKVITSAKVKSVESAADGSGVLSLDAPTLGETTISFDRILIAIGRSPRTSNLGLDNAGVKQTKQGFVAINDSLQTTNKNIYAAGDITGHPQFTHVAGVHGSTAGSNAILGLRRKAEVSVIPRVTFTDPEIAAVGISTISGDSRLRILERTNHEVDRAIAESRQDGTTKLVVDSKGRIVGGLCIGPRAGESLAEITLAIRLGLTTRQLSSTMHPYPTYGDGLWNIAIADLRTQLQAPRINFVLGLLRKLSTLRAHRF